MSRTGRWPMGRLYGRWPNGPTLWKMAEWAERAMRRCLWLARATANTLFYAADVAHIVWKQLKTKGMMARV